VRQFDIESAYLDGKLEEELFVEVPEREQKPKELR